MKHLILIPSYNPGEIVLETVCEAIKYWQPIWVVIDGSTDNSPNWLLSLSKENKDLCIHTLERNMGKGYAILHGLKEAHTLGFTHVLTMDSDGQHPASLIKEFMNCSIQNPEAMILGKPIFDDDAPRARIYGRKTSNFLVRLESHGADIGDSLFGFRVYPLQSLMEIMQRQTWMRRFDFDVEAVVRMTWAGIKSINLDAPVKYPSAVSGGISHFNYLRDNLLLTWMHFRLLFESLIRIIIYPLFQKNKS